MTTFSGVISIAASLFCRNTISDTTFSSFNDSFRSESNSSINNPNWESSSITSPSQRPEMDGSRKLGGVE